MDRISLTENELIMLKAFIRTKGFKDDVVINEILDHFACKVEELMMNDPYQKFEEAMRKAHLSFGVMGFQPIAQTFENSIRSRYSRIFWQTFGNTLVSIKWIPLILLTFFATYELYLWSQGHHISLVNNNIVPDILYITFLLEFIVFIFLAGGWKQFQRNYFMRFVKIPFLLTIVITFGPSKEGIYPDVWMAATYYALLAVCLLVSSIASLSLLQKALKEFAESQPSSH